MKDKHNVVAIKNTLTCQICGKDFENKELLNRHRKLCQCVLCTVCSVSFKSKEKLDQHMEKHASEKGERKFVCPHCTCRFKCSKVLSTHIVKRHTNDMCDIGMNYECPQCDIMFRGSTLLKIHLESRHNFFMSNLESVCVICFEDCDNELAKHMHVEHKKTFVCQFEKCTKKFRTQNSLSCHEKTHEPNYIPDLSCSVRILVDFIEFLLKNGLQVCSKILPDERLLKEHFAHHGKELTKKAKQARKKAKTESSDEST